MKQASTFTIVNTANVAATTQSVTVPAGAITASVYSAVAFEVGTATDTVGLPGAAGATITGIPVGALAATGGATGGTFKIIAASGNLGRTVVLFEIA